MDQEKVYAIEDWDDPNNSVRAFQGMEKYHRKFLDGYSKITTPLTNLLKKEKPWRWTEK